MIEERLQLGDERLGHTSDTGRVRDWAKVIAWLPVLAIVAVTFAVTAIYVRSIHTFVVMPDELGYVKQALQIARTGLPVGPHDFYFVSWAQLLPTLSAPIFAATDMVSAFYAAHTLYAFLLASTAIPAYLLATELRLGRLASYLVAALSVVVPWLALAGLIMTENVAYPVFAWAMLAILRAADSPSTRRDALAIAAIALAFFARSQFLALGPVLFVTCLVHDVLMSLAVKQTAGVRAGLVAGVRQSLRNHRLLWAVTAIAILGALLVTATGSGQTALGNYNEPLSGQLLPPGTLSGGIAQLDVIVIAVGVAPLTLSVAWCLATVARPRDPARHAFAVLLTVTVTVLILLVGSFQQRFLSGAVTDRYLFYVVPLLFVGTAAWVVDRRGSVLTVGAVAAAVAWMVHANSLHPLPTVVIIAPSFALHRVFVGQGAQLTRALGLPTTDPRNLIAIVTTLFVLFAVLINKRLPSWQAVLAVLVPLLVYGMVNTGYTLSKLVGEYSGEPASHPRELTSIDRNVPSDAKVGLVLAPTSLAARKAPTDTYWTWWQPSFWNETVQRDFVFPGGDTFAQGFATTIHQDLAHGRLTGLAGSDYLLKLASDSRFGLRAPIMNGGSKTLPLYNVTTGARLLYGSSGVDQYTRLASDGHAFVRIFGPGGSAPKPERVVLTLQTVAAKPGCPCTLNLGKRYGTARLPPRTANLQPFTHIFRIVKVPPNGYVQLNLDPRGPTGSPAGQSVLLSSVEITAA